MTDLSTPSGQRPARASFITSGAPQERIHGWEAHNATALVALSCETPRGQLLDATEVNLSSPAVGMAFVRGSRHRVVRDAKLIDAKPTHAIAVYMPLRARAAFEQSGRRRIVAPGQVVVCDSDMPFEREFSPGVEEFAVTVSSDTEPLASAGVVKALARGPIISDLGASPNRAGRALFSIVCTAIREESYLAVNPAVIGGLVASLVDERWARSVESRRAEALAFIDQHLFDHDLSSTSIAVACNVGERTLSRWLADMGTSLPGYILERRLDAAHAMLADPRNSGLDTATAAARCGFTSRSRFSETFRARFGATPGAVRRAS